LSLERPAVSAHEAQRPAELPLAGSGYGIGIDDEGHRVEFIAAWPDLDALRPMLEQHAEPVYVEVEPSQVLTGDGEICLPHPDQLRERAAFVRAALADSEAR
jgi:hypothetical protein